MTDLLKRKQIKFYALRHKTRIPGCLLIANTLSECYSFLLQCLFATACMKFWCVGRREIRIHGYTASWASEFTTCSQLKVRRESGMSVSALHISFYWHQFHAPMLRHARYYYYLPAWPDKPFPEFCVWRSMFMSFENPRQLLRSVALFILVLC